MDYIIFFVAGVFVGWHFPQPAWAQTAVDWVVTKVKGFITKK